MQILKWGKGIKVVGKVSDVILDEQEVKELKAYLNPVKKETKVVVEIKKDAKKVTNNKKR